MSVVSQLIVINKKVTQEIFTKWLESENDMMSGNMCLSQPHQIPFWHYCLYIYYHFLLISEVCTKEIQCCNGKYDV